MHSIESLLCNFYKNTVNTTGYMHNFIGVRSFSRYIVLLCNREHNKYKAL